MNVERATIVDYQGLRQLEMVIDGQPANVFEPKLPLLEAGYVALLDGDWGDRLTINLPDNWHPNYPNPTTLRGVTNDPVVVELARRFVSGHPPGELAIPS